MKDYLIREREVCRRIQVGITTLNLWVKQGEFPPPVRTRPNKAWKSSQVDRYIATMAERELRARPLGVLPAINQVRA